MINNNEVVVSPIDILYEDQNVLVIDKPAGVAMHKININDKNTTIRDIFSDKLADNDKLRGGIVHRLDKDTSGVVIMAKNYSTLSFLQDQFAKRDVDKTYLALVWGSLKHHKARIELPLARSNKSPVAMIVSPGGRESVTEYKLIQELPPYSYLELKLHTGRTHQIRVQFAHIGHSVVGDKMYSKKPTPRGLQRQFLHAHKLSLLIPGQKNKKTFEAPLASDLAGFLEVLYG